MRYLILSDMHANAEAFGGVLHAVRRKRFDATLVLGDLVGYGAGPNQVVDACRRLRGAVFSVRGNHDKVVAGIEDGSNFNEAAMTAALWTSRRLTAANLRFVRDLPPGPHAVTEEVAICHGSPADEDLYLFAAGDALDAFASHPARVIFFGHTHVPSVFIAHPHGIQALRIRGAATLRLEPGKRYLINPGSIGQPRDRDPRASYMTFDSERGIARWHRLAYPVAEAQRRILRAGLPQPLAERLAVGG